MRTALANHRSPNHTINAQAVPKHQPASTSLGQCTPRYTRLIPISTASRLKNTTTATRPASPAVARHALGQHQRQRQRQRQIDRGRDHRMAAGEAGIGHLDQMRDELGPGRATALARRQKSVRFGPSNARFPPEVRLLCHRRDRDQQARDRCRAGQAETDGG